MKHITVVTHSDDMSSSVHILNCSYIVKWKLCLVKGGQQWSVIYIGNPVKDEVWQVLFCLFDISKLKSSQIIRCKDKELVFYIIRISLEFQFLNLPFS